MVFARDVGLSVGTAVVGVWSRGVFVAAVLAAVVVVQPTASQGCSGNPQLHTGNHTLEVEDPLLGRIERKFALVVPASLRASAHGSPSAVAPLVLGFHGQGHNPWDWKPRPYFAELAEKYGWVAAFPAALREHGDRKPDETWNCGTAGDNSTCLPGTTGTNTMDSCRKLGKYGRCNWATCYDDVAFVLQLIAKLQQELCLDSKRYFLVGESNGGMFTHYLIQRHPGMFLAAAPVFASPLVGYLVGPAYELLARREEASRTSVLQLHDRSDDTIPWQGANSSDGWLYESLERTVGAWSAVHGCSPVPSASRPHNSGGPKHLDCWEFKSCASGGHAAYCMYDGEHGDWPGQPRAADLIWNFFVNATRRLNTHPALRLERPLYT